MPAHDHSTIEITEQLHCPDRSCPDATTMIKISNEEGKEILLKISKPLVYVRKWDVEDLSKKAIVSSI